jgi:hypothetical protein
MTILFLKKWLLFFACLVGAALLWMGVQVFRVFQVSSPVSESGSVSGAWGGALAVLPAVDVFSRPGEDDIERRAAALVLSGTIQIEGGGRVRNGVEYVALVDDEESGRQHLVSVGDELGPFRIREISPETMVFGIDNRNWELEMTGRVRPRAVRRGTPSTEDGESVAWEDMPALETSPFGKRVGDNQWVIEREPVMEYVRDLVENPARAISLYDSFRGVEQENQDLLDGFRIQKRGEHDFFRAMGLEDGMIIRSANMMEMDHQVRAEIIMREFIRGELDAVVLQVDENGERKGMIYIIR